MRHFISLGAGVQSSTVALRAAAGEIEPMPEGAIFADTQAEPRPVYNWLDWLEKQLPFPVYRVTKGSLTESAITPRLSKRGGTYYQTAIPFHTVGSSGKAGLITHRTCTRDYKIRPIMSQLRAIIGAAEIRRWNRAHRAELAELNAHRAYLAAKARAKKLGRPFSDPVVSFPTAAWATMQANALACQWIGISLDEMQRMKPAREPWVLTRWPLIEQRITRAGCLAWMEYRGYPTPPRSACVYCPFRSNREWRWLRDNDPEGWTAAVAFDREARQLREGTSLKSSAFVHRSLVPLDQADLRTDADRGQLLMWDDECSGVCGV